MKYAKTVQKNLSAMIFTSSVLLTSASVVFANEQLTGPMLALKGNAHLQQATNIDSVATRTQSKTDEFGGKVNLNLASFEQLIALPGIGKSKAAAIIQYREEVGVFKTLEDIQNIKGIGVKLFAKLQDKIKI